MRLYIVQKWFSDPSKWYFCELIRKNFKNKMFSIFGLQTNSFIKGIPTLCLNFDEAISRTYAIQILQDLNLWRVGIITNNFSQFQYIIPNFRSLISWWNFNSSDFFYSFLSVRRRQNSLINNDKKINEYWKSWKKLY